MTTLIVIGLLGLILLSFGAEKLVHGASSLGLRVGMRPIIIGLTIVAFGTSAPEAVVSLLAGVRGQADIAIGNVVGSNIFNIAVVLGMAAIISPLRADSGTIRREMPYVIGSAALLWVMSLDRVIGRADGALLLAAFGGFLWTCLRGSGNGKSAEDAGVSPNRMSVAASWGYILGGLAMLVAGAQALVWSAVGLARAFGVSELVIGLTIVAAGTSLPELATSMVAAYRGHDDISIGNVLGSNVFNVLFVLGAASLIQPIRVDFAVLHRDLPLMFLISVAILPLLLTGRKIGRVEGFAMLVSYAVYLAFLVRSSGSPAV